MLQPSHRRLSSVRSFASAATSRQKRALNKTQLEGSKSTPGGGGAPKPPTAGATTPTPPPSGGGDSSNMFILGAVIVGAGLGGAYAMDLLPSFETQPTKTPPQENIVVEPESTTVTTETETDTPPVEEEAAATAETETTTTRDEASEQSTSLSSEEAPPPTEDEAAASTTVAEVAESSAAPVVQDVVVESSTAEPVKEEPQPQPQHEPTVDLALQELQARLVESSSRALSEAHKELATLSSLDMSDIDDMTVTQLKVRLVQMAKEIEERTKWEAVRLKEFLALKERETADEYLQMLKKQRLDYEALMERKLREQEAGLTSSAAAALKSKEEAVEAVVDHALKLQENQFLEEKDLFQQQTQAEMSAKYEQLFGSRLASEKAELTQRLDAKLQLMDALSKKLSELELALKTSRDFESGSVQVHRMSAAAMALVDSLESSEPASGQVTALEQAVSDSNPVIVAALKSLPDRAITGSGVPTLQELQTRFEDTSYPNSRHAAMVPKGSATLEGQLLGIALSTFKAPPGPDDAAPTKDDTDAPEYVLSRARRHVQLGELELAVSQLDKLTGQPAYTTRDWKERAKERVAVDKVLKLLRMECALANDSMSHK